MSIALLFRTYTHDMTRAFKPFTVWEGIVLPYFDTTLEPIISYQFVLFLQRLIKMNMPIMGDNTVLFTSTLFALIRTALGIFSTGDPAYADSELRRTIKRLWPKTSKKTLDKMIPLQSGKNKFYFSYTCCWWLLLEFLLMPAQPWSVLCSLMVALWFWWSFTFCVVFHSSLWSVEYRTVIIP